MEKRKLDRRQFNTAIKSLYKIEKTPEDKRIALRKFYNEHQTDDDTLYIRYSRLKFYCELEGSAYLGAVVGLAVSTGYSFVQQVIDLPGAVEHPIVAFLLFLLKVAMSIVIFLPFILALLPISECFIRAFMRKNMLLVYPYEIAILEEELHIREPNTGVITVTIKALEGSKD